MVAKQQTVKEYWKALAWSLESLWQGNIGRTDIILTGLRLLTFLKVWGTPFVSVRALRVWEGRFESLESYSESFKSFESLRGKFWELGELQCLSLRGLETFSETSVVSVRALRVLRVLRVWDSEQSAWSTIVVDVGPHPRYLEAPGHNRAWDFWGPCVHPMSVCLVRAWLE